MTDMTLMTRKKIEAALDGGQLSVQVSRTPSRYWYLRRNGKTQTWRTRPGEFRIPVRAGIRFYAAITDLNMCDECWRITPLAMRRT